MNKKILALLTLIIISLPTFSSARENATGIWIGTVTSTSPPHQTTEVYISIHETETLSVVIFLSAVAETGDLLSSTYIGSKIGTIDDTLKSYGENAYLPVNYDPLINKVYYGSYPNIWILLRDEGTSEILIASDLIAFDYPVQLKKIVGAK